MSWQRPVVGPDGVRVQPASAAEARKDSSPVLGIKGRHIVRLAYLCVSLSSVAVYASRLDSVAAIGIRSSLDSEEHSQFTSQSVNQSAEVLSFATSERIKPTWRISREGREASEEEEAGTNLSRKRFRTADHRLVPKWRRLADLRRRCLWEEEGQVVPALSSGAARAPQQRTTSAPVQAATHRQPSRRCPEDRRVELGQPPTTDRPR